jgi:hypothetical protein
MIPSGVKESKLYSIKPTDGDGDFTFSRGTDTATRVNSSGLIEKERGNFVSWSNDFSKASWLKIQSSISAGFSGYDGSSNAWKAVENTANSNHYFYQNALNSNVSTLSLYAKTNGRDLQLRVDGVGTNKAFVNYDLSAGSIGLSGGTGLIDSNIESVGGGWYRCSFAVSDSGTYGMGIVMITDAATSTELSSYIGDGVSGIFIQDAQLEQGLVATDYIETSAPVYVGITDNLPRLDYHNPDSPTPNSCPSLLLEPSRTNLAVHSEYFNSYSAVRLNRNANSATSPEGVTNATKLVPTAVLGTHYFVQTNAVTSGQKTTISFYAKADGYNFIRAVFSSINGAYPDYYQSFDLSDGSLDDSSGIDSADIEPMGNDWYRCTATATAAASVSSANYFFLYETSNTPTFTADGTSGVLIYGLQVETNASYPTSYIPTYGTSASRALEYGISDISSLLTSNEGTLLIHLNDDANSGGYGSGALSIGLQAIGGANFVGWASNSPADTELRGIYKVSGSTYYLGSSTAVNTECKILIKWDSGSASFFKDGALVNTQSVGGFSGQPLDEYLLPNQYRTGNFPMKQTLVFPTALTDAECIALTTI